jgi:hypothetical protein
MKLGIMQPYLFPYLGYFQLLSAVDRFVIYDDVAFIKQGWINRNHILVAGRAHLFSVPLRDVSSFRPIFEIEVDRDGYPAWRRKFLATIDQSYRKAPFFEGVRLLLESVFQTAEGSIAALALRSIREVAQYLGLAATLIETSRSYGNHTLNGQKRVIDICLRERADHYINAIGGRSLYAAEEFAVNGIKLQFIRSRPIAYPQFGDAFVPNLSIIDVLMFNSRDRVRELLAECDLI